MQLTQLTVDNIDAVTELVESLRLGAHIEPAFIRTLTLDDPTARGLNLVALSEGDPVGFCFGCLRQGAGFVKLFGVAPEYRRRGVGTELFDALETSLRARGVGRIAVEGSSPGYFLPGVELGCTEAIGFLETRGYQTDRNTRVDMEVDLRRVNLDTASLEARLASEGLVLRRAQPSEIERTALFALQHFSRDWGLEVAETARLEGPPPLFVALAGEEVVGFAAYDVTGPRRFGPTGTRPDYRRRGIGAALLKDCLRSMRERGDAAAEIAWAGPLGFYARAVGARIHRAYWGYHKALE